MNDVLKEKDPRILMRLAKKGDKDMIMPTSVPVSTSNLDSTLAPIE